MTQPLRVCDANAHYLEFRGTPTVLVTSAEHYGAVINADFDMEGYLDSLAAYELNYTRIYPGAYFETEDFFCEGNTLGPRRERHILPWARSDQGEYALGGRLFDLDRWDPAYFERLRRFVHLASDRDIVVEVCFYNVMYPQVWELMPLHQHNNVQRVGRCDYRDVQSGTDPDLLGYQVAYVRKIVEELNDFDNVIFEIIDEPGNYGVPASTFGPWIGRMIDAVRGAEAALPNRHLIAQQVIGTIGGEGDFSRDARVDIATGQYVWAVSGGQLGGMRLLDSIYEHGKPIELNESTYFPGNYNQSGVEAEPGPDPVAGYRAEAWEFMIGGGAAYNHLNALYSTDNASGRDTGNEELQTGLRNLRRFLEKFEFWKMAPTIPIRGFATGLRARCIAEPGKQYALYLHHSTLIQQERYRAEPGDYQDQVVLSVPPGTYHVEYIDPQSLDLLKVDRVSNDHYTLSLATPRYRTDIAIRAYRHDE